MKVLLFCNGQIKDYDIVGQYTDGYGLIICCDGGLMHAHKMGLNPDFIIGDMDSVDRALLKSYSQKGAKIITYPEKKDYTDLELGIDLALENNPDEIVVLGATGDRLDHTLANIQVLIKALRRGTQAYIADESNLVCLIDSEMVFTNRQGATVSLIPLTNEVNGITLLGFEFPLKNATIKIGQTIGISNVIIENKARVELSSGILIVVCTRENQV